MLLKEFTSFLAVISTTYSPTSGLGGSVERLRITLGAHHPYRRSMTSATMSSSPSCPASRNSERNASSAPSISCSSRPKSRYALTTDVKASRPSPARAASNRALTSLGSAQAGSGFGVSQFLLINNSWIQLPPALGRLQFTFVLSVRHPMRRLNKSVAQQIIRIGSVAEIYPELGYENTPHRILRCATR